MVATKLCDNFTAGTFRDAAGLGRNVTIEVLEYFDLSGFTQRDGNTRTIIGDGDRIFHDPKNDPSATAADDMDTSMTAG